MSYKYDRQIAQRVVESALLIGLVPYLAERGTYGYITDSTGDRVISFGVDLGGVNYSSNWKAEDGQRAGSGESLSRHAPATAEALQANWNRVAKAPRTYGAYGTVVRLCTEQEHRDRYQKSSQYRLQKGTERLNRLDRLTSMVSAFRSFRELLFAEGGYRPSLDVSDPDCLHIADEYDDFQASLGDDRRAFRYGKPARDLVPGRAA